MTSCRSRDFVLERVFVLEVMADLQPYRFEPERVPNPEDSESENEEVNDRLEGTFWCTCERCEIIPRQRECVSCENSRRQKTKWKVVKRVLPWQQHCRCHSFPFAMYIAGAKFKENCFKTPTVIRD